ncbi:hypothetical protein TFUB22_01463 [Tannerella forsythia]|nr:hypothetical protein TFUB22_01029 [Tannerella forsythia]SCQ22668.1 hypothetical protein TFUB22_01463 [Tannerella forsythia]
MERIYQLSLGIADGDMNPRQGFPHLLFGNHLRVVSRYKVFQFHIRGRMIRVNFLYT